MNRPGRFFVVVCFGQLCAALVVAASHSGSCALAADPWADAVVAYEPGANPVPGFADPTTALGSPERFTGEQAGFPGVVTPFNAPFGPDEMVSIGEGGFFTVRFDDPIVDDPNNPFGIDLLVFGNSFVSDDFTAPDGRVDAVSTEGGTIEVSTDGVQFFVVHGIEADGLFPTNGFADAAGPFDSTPGNVPSDFTRPVDPAFDPIGRTFDEILAAYDGSGGGAGVDIASTGLASIAYVRVSNPVGSGTTPEIDAFADVRAVPEPSAGALAWSALLLSCIAGRHRRRS